MGLKHNWRLYKLNKRLKKMPKEDLAYLRALAAFRHCFFGEMFGIANLQAFERPTQFPKQTCLHLYQALEEGARQLSVSRAQILRILKKTQPQLVAAYKQHERGLDLSLRVWMATLAMGFEESLVVKTMQVWDYFDLPEDSYREAIEKIKHIEHELSMLTTNKPSLCESLNDAHWFRLCKFKPKVANPQQ